MSAKFWNTWGATIIWIVTVVGTALLAWHDLDKKLALIDQRLTTIEYRLPLPRLATVATSGEKDTR
jgi:hypothetical protein